MNRNTLVLTLVLPLAAAQANAQGGAVLGEETVELTPFVGYRTGGGFSVIEGGPGFDIENSVSYGGLIDFNLKSNNFKIEVLYSRQHSRVQAEVLLGSEFGDLAVEYYQAGVLQEVGNAGARWYIGVLLGGTRFVPRGFDGETYFSGSIGGGLKFFPSKRFGLRFDGRAYATFTSGSAGAFCSNGRCVFAYSGSTFWQGDFTGGLIIAF
ncbi:MAG TPA: hypothetical protein VKA01_07240 [Vicinamibacteria bacterium]|nr:hypothetical protein [Vicinamibacteria bacterium]